MRDIIFILLIAISLTNNLLAQDSHPCFQNDDEQIDTLLSSDIYAGQALFGYMNGGAEFYLEYGFEQLIVQTLQYRHENYKIEIFVMDSPLAAWGVFSLSAHHCLSIDSLSGYWCVSDYQCQVVRGRYYLSLTCDDGLKKIDIEALQLVHYIYEQFPEADIPLPEALLQLMQENLLPLSKLKYVQGPIGLQNAYPAWTPLLEDCSNYQLFLLSVPTKDKSIKLAMFNFYLPTQQRLVLRKFGFSHVRRDFQQQQSSAGSQAYKKYSTRQLMLLQSRSDDKQTVERFISFLEQEYAD